MAEELIKLQRPFTVVTASLSVAGLLAPVETMSVILLGGRVRGRTLGTVDYWATNMLSDLVIDLAVLGTNGISRDRGLTTPDPAVSAVKHKVVEVSRRRLFVGVHTKFGTHSFCKFADVADFETLITDTGLSTHRRAPLHRSRPGGDPRVARERRAVTDPPAGLDVTIPQHTAPSGSTSNGLPVRATHPDQPERTHPHATASPESPSNQGTDRRHHHHGRAARRHHGVHRRCRR